MTHKKALGILLAVVLTMVAFNGNSFADWASLCGVSINDATDDKDIHGNANSFVKLFNEYFATELGPNTYLTGNDLFNGRGVDPEFNWISSNTSVVGAYKAASLFHELYVLDSDENNLGMLYSPTGTDVSNGITDLSGEGTNINTDGLTLTFQLKAHDGSSVSYLWNSSPTNNYDLKVHMIALEITDLYNAKTGGNFTDVYMFGWEDLDDLNAQNYWVADWDYQDFVVIMTNVTPTPATPEPATMLLWAFGSFGVAGTTWAKKRRSKKRA